MMIIHNVQDDGAVKDLQNLADGRGKTCLLDNATWASHGIGEHLVAFL